MQVKNILIKELTAPYEKTNDRNFRKAQIVNKEQALLCYIKFLSDIKQKDNFNSMFTIPEIYTVNYNALCRLHSLNLKYTNLSGMDLSNLDISYSNLENTNLKNTIFNNTEVFGVNFRNTNLHSAKLRGINIHPIGHNTYYDGAPAPCLLPAHLRLRDFFELIRKTVSIINHKQDSLMTDSQISLFLKDTKNINKLKLLIEIPKYIINGINNITK